MVVFRRFLGTVFSAHRLAATIAILCIGSFVTPAAPAAPTAASSYPCADGGPCQVGDIGPGGGIVFYVHDAGTFACGAALELTCAYLEAAPTSGTSAWTDVALPFSGNTTDWLLSDSALGYGYKNTIGFIAQNATANTAITSATAYRGPNNLSDWFLPSKTELQYLQNQILLYQYLTSAF